MDRGWYFRFALMAALTIGAWLTLWPTLDEWIPAPDVVKEYFAGQISPGLDIQGGLRLVYEVDVDEAVKNRRDILADRLLRELGILLGEVDEDDTPGEAELARIRERVTIEGVGQRDIRLTFSSSEDAAKLDRDWLRERFVDQRTGRGTLVIEGRGEGAVRLTINEDFIEGLGEDAVERAKKTVENRVNALGVSDLTVSKNGTNLVIEIPGGDPTSRLISAILAATTGVDETDEGVRFTLDEELAARTTGLTENQVGDTLTRIIEQTYTVGNDDEGNPIREPIMERDGEELVIKNMEELRELSTFEKVRSIIARTARLDFQVVAHEDNFVQQIASEVQERADESGISIERKAATVDGREVTESFFYASGEGSRQRLQDFIGSLQIPDGRELLLGKAAPPRADDDEEDDDGAPAVGAEAWRTYLVYASTDVTGEDVKDAYVSTDQQNRPVVILEFNSDGADAWARLTGENVAREVAIVLDEIVESAPVIQDRIGGGVTQITLGGYRSYDELTREAGELVVVLKAGALPAPIRPINEQLIGPTLGRDSVARGAQGALIGVLLVLVFMLFYYEVAGIIADLMVVLNLLFLLSALAFLGQYFSVTLTLPGVAGIALTIGMAVDANVLITERIREELRLGKSPRSAVDQGFKRAFWSIFDAQFTTFIAGVVLFQYGTGPIKGFAVTLMLGIATSLFTGVFCSKVLLDWIVRGLRVQRLRVG